MYLNIIISFVDCRKIDHIIDKRVGFWFVKYKGKLNDIYIERAKCIVIKYLKNIPLYLFHPRILPPEESAWKKQTVFEVFYISIYIYIYIVCILVEGDRGAGTRENKDGRWTGSGRGRIGMQEPCEGRRREKNERQ